MPLIPAVVFVISVFCTFSPLDHFSTQDGELLLSPQRYMRGEHTHYLCACMRYIFCGLAMSAKPILLYKREEAQGQVAYNRALGSMNSSLCRWWGSGCTGLLGIQVRGLIKHCPTAGDPQRGHIKEPCLLCFCSIASWLDLESLH